MRECTGGWIRDRRGRDGTWIKRPLKYTKNRKLIVSAVVSNRLRPVTRKVRLNQFSVSRNVTSHPIESRQLVFIASRNQTTRIPAAAAAAGISFRRVRRVRATT